MAIQKPKEAFYGTWKTTKGTTVVTITQNKFHQVNSVSDLRFDIAKWTPVENSDAESKENYPNGYIVELTNPNYEAYTLGWEDRETLNFYMHKENESFIRDDLSFGIFTKK